MKRTPDHRNPAAIVYAPPIKPRVIAWFKRADHKRDRRHAQRAAADELTRMRTEEGL